MVRNIEIVGGKTVADNLIKVGEALHGREFMKNMNKATLIVLADAKRLAPVDTGRLRAGLNSSVERSIFLGLGVGVVGIIGVSANVEYAPYMEEGTGVFAGQSRHKFPPPQALEGWARRHGMNAFLVARSIYLAGGLKPRHYLKDAIEKNEKRVFDILDGAIKIVIRNHGFG